MSESKFKSGSMFRKNIIWKGFLKILDLKLFQKIIIGNDLIRKITVVVVLILIFKTTNPMILPISECPKQENHIYTEETCSKIESNFLFYPSMTLLSKKKRVSKMTGDFLKCIIINKIFTAEMSEWYHSSILVVSITLNISLVREYSRRHAGESRGVASLLMPLPESNFTPVSCVILQDVLCLHDMFT